MVCEGKVFRPRFEAGTLTPRTIAYCVTSIRGLKKVDEMNVEGKRIGYGHVY
jgi:hypothetical protein